MFEGCKLHAKLLLFFEICKHIIKKQKILLILSGDGRLGSPYNNNLDNLFQQLAPRSTLRGAHGNIIPCRGRMLIAAECCWFMLLRLLSNISLLYTLHFTPIANRRVLVPQEHKKRHPSGVLLCPPRDSNPGPTD